MSAPDQLPRLLAFPPLLYLAALTVGVLLHQVFPVPILPQPAATVVGAMLVGASLLLLTWAMLTLRRAGTTVLPGGTTIALALDGPYRWTRNPMCLSVGGLCLGAAFLMNAVAPAVLFVPVFVLVERRVIRWEEGRLEAKFGAPYVAYRGRVRRWL